MALSSLSIATKAALMLQDIANVRWTASEMATWINAGCRELVMLKPNAITANVAMKLTAGTKQSIDGALFKKTVDGSDITITPAQLLEVSRNMGATGKEVDAGNAITSIPRQLLDVTMPNWHTISGTDIKYFMFDAKDPKTFYVYPKAPATPIYIEVVISRCPVNTLLDTATVLGVADIDAGIDNLYENVLIDYVLYRAYSKDSEFTASSARSQWHYQAFQSALGIKLQNEQAMAPDKPPAAPAQQQAQG